jgi:hypothetical protein
LNTNGPTAPVPEMDADARIEYVLPLAVGVLVRLMLFVQLLK